MDDMVEKVGRAISAANYMDVVLWDGDPLPRQYELMARAAIAAMREPTEEMLASRRGMTAELKLILYQAMIDAALSKDTDNG